MDGPANCPRCGETNHHIYTRSHVNRFAVGGSVVVAVECTDCGHRTKVR